MTNKSKKELTILIGILALLSYSVYSQFSADRSVPAAAKLPGSRSVASTALNEVLAVELLENEALEFSGVKRNIFEFGSKPVIEKETFIPVPTPQPDMAAAPAVPAVHYLGFYYEKDTGLKMASLSNSGRIYVGKTGEVIGGKYRILEIAADHVILRLITEEGKVIRVPLGKSPATFFEWNEDQER